MHATERRLAEARGRWAEGVAALFLRLKGYRILARRAKTPVGEIDLVAARAGVLAFVEVKARRRRDEGMWAVAPHQMRRITRAARYWLAGQPAFSGHDCRFDIIVVISYRMPLHLVDVFQDEGRSRG
jgi:putative endonuclease